MKKRIVFIALLLGALLLGACQPQVASVEKNILVPTGAPSVLFVDMIEAEGFNVSVVNGIDPIMAEFLNPEQAFDFIVAPIINVSRLQVEEKTPYKLIEILSWGNLVILGQEGVDLNTARLGVFAPQGVPGVITQKLLELEGLNPTIQPAPTMADAMALYLGGQVDAVLMAFPMAQNLIAQHNATVLMDIQEVYATHFGSSNFPQAGLYVSRKFYDEHKANISVLVNQIKSTHQMNVSAPERLNAVSEVVKTTLMMESMAPMANNYARLGLNPTYALEKLTELNTFLSLFELELLPTMIVR